MVSPALTRVLVAVAFVASASMRPTAAPQARMPQNVLAIHSGAEDFPANPVLDAGIRDALASRADVPIDYFAEYLESDRFTTEEASLAFADYVREKYRNRRIDLVIAITDASLRFVLERRAELFRDAPIVFAGLQTPDETIRRAGTGLTGVRVGTAYAETLKLALALHPSTERVFVVAHSSDEGNIASVRRELRDVSRQVTLAFVNEETVARLLAVTRAIPPRSVILYIWHSQHDPGNVVYPDRVARLVVQASARPVYGTSDFYIGSGVVGGVIRSTRDTGLRVGEMALQILGGRPAQAIPIETARLVPTFDWRQVRRWGIDPSRLPPGSHIQFRTPAEWESYRRYIVATAIVVAAQLVLIAALLMQRSRRRRAEATIQAREATLQTSYVRIRQLAGRLLNAQEAARAEIARDLHDDVCQELVGLSMGVSSIRRTSGHIQSLQAQHALSQLQHRALDIIEGIRRLSHDLHPSTLRLVGLVGALQAHCIEVEKRHDVQVDFQTAGALEHLQPDVSLCLFRIAQEALRNGAAHGDARRLAVRIQRSDAHIDLSVTDDGRGFDLEAVRWADRGLGLVSMEERARLAGGDLQIITRPGYGTTICVRVPVAADVSAKTDDVHMRMVAVASPPNARDRV